MTHDIRFFAPWPGVVIDNEDPESRHRIRATVPGLQERTQWAVPMTAGGGSAQRGGHITPDVEADVVIQWLGGDPERPIYSGGSWGIPSAGSEMPEAVKGTEAHKVQMLQIGHLQIAYDHRERNAEAGTGELAYIEDLRSNMAIVFDMKSQGISIVGEAGVNIKAAGIVSIEGAMVVINGRHFRDKGGPA